MNAKINPKPKHAILTLVAIAALLGLNYGIKKYHSVEQIKKLHQLVAKEFRLDPRTKTTDCKAQKALPDHACTPGAIISTATKAEICAPGYSSTARDVPSSEKDQVYAEYGISMHTQGRYEIDHFISLELGGANDIANLWPEAASPVLGLHEKDQVENYLHDTLCAGQISLQEARELVSNNWMQVYKLLHP